MKKTWLINKYWFQIGISGRSADGRLIFYSLKWFQNLIYTFQPAEMEAYRLILNLHMGGGGIKNFFANSIRHNKLKKESEQNIE